MDSNHIKMNSSWSEKGAFAGPRFSTLGTKRFLQTRIATFCRQFAKKCPIMIMYTFILDAKQHENSVEENKTIEVNGSERRELDKLSGVESS